MQLEYSIPSAIKIPNNLAHQIFPLDEYMGKNAKLCILGIEEYRGNAQNKGCEAAPDALREQLFKLKGFPKINIVDAGNIKMGESFRDSLYALKETIAEILNNNLIPIVLGGDKTMLCGHEKAYHSTDSKYINLLQIDETFELSQEHAPDINQNNYLNHILKQEPNLIFNFTQLGYQSYFVDFNSIELIKKLEFECFRLGDIRADIKEFEPIVRDADLLAFNISALNGVDGIGHQPTSPNGFTAVETCQMMRYAGLSDRLTSIGFYGYNPKSDIRNHTAQVVAQAIWYFIKGVAERKLDYPIVDEKQFTKYVVSSKEIGYDITFLKSIKSDRWWIKIPDEYVKYKSHQLFPCSYKDYQAALNDEIPERWWKAYNKLV